VLQHLEIRRIVEMKKRAQRADRSLCEKSFRWINCTLQNDVQLRYGFFAPPFIVYVSISKTGAFSAVLESFLCAYLISNVKMTLERPVHRSKIPSIQCFSTLSASSHFPASVCVNFSSSAFCSFQNSPSSSTISFACEIKSAISA
jgi:hypothetical protein